jgi:DNA-binding HxlR family transcriptional regulator
MSANLAHALEVLGDRWTLQLVAGLLDGPRRFGEMAESLDGIAPNVLTTRLRQL